MKTSAQPVRRPADSGRTPAVARSRSADRPLKVGPVHDRYEQEAALFSGSRSSTLGSAGPPFAPSAPPAVHEVLRMPGQPLDAELRSSLEPRFGFDFSRVRVHADTRAAESARSVGALAYTVGTDIAFASGQYRPGSSRGRELVAHELTHVVQQQAIGPVLQRLPGPPAPAPTEEDLQKVLQEYKAELGREVPAWLQEWARKSQEGAGRALTLDELRSAMNIKRIHGVDPPIFQKPGTPEEPEKLPPGAIGANEILPFAKGSRVLVTQLVDKLITAEMKAKIKMWTDTFMPKPPGGTAGTAGTAGTPAADKDKPGAGTFTDVLQEQGMLLLDLFTDPEVTKSVTAEVTESLPQRVDAKVTIPAIPAKGSRPALDATEAEFSLDRFSSNYRIMVLWRRGDKAGRLPLLYLNVKRGANNEILVTKAEGDSPTLEIVGKQGGGLTLQVTDIMGLAKLILGVDEPLKVVTMETLGAPAGSKAEAKEKEKRVEQARSQVGSAGGNNEILYGSGLQYQTGGAAYQGLDPAISLGWRFTFKPLGKLVQVPVQLQLDYLPPAGGYGQASAGLQTVLPTKVPVTLRILGGLRAGATQGTEPPGTGAGPGAQAGAGVAPLAGPTFGGGAGVELGPKVNLEVQVDKFWNVMKDTVKKGPEGGVGVQLGAAVRF